MTRALQIGCELRYSTAFPVAAVFQVEPRTEPGVVELATVELQDVTWQVDGAPQPRIYRDIFGNLCHRTELQPGTTTVRFSALAQVPDEVDAADPQAPRVPVVDLPDEALRFLLPSRFCESDKLANVAHKLFRNQQPGYEQVQAVCAWAWSYLTYAGGTTNSFSSAADCYVSGFGVCRDYAHLMVAMCRALNYPTRYCAGYLPDMDVPPLPTPMDFHAWVEVYLGGRWWVFDPRHNARRKGRVKIGHGRDAADLPVSTIYGGATALGFSVTAQEA